MSCIFTEPALEWLMIFKQLFNIWTLNNPSFHIATILHDTVLVNLMSLKHWSTHYSFGLKNISGKKLMKTLGSYISILFLLSPYCQRSVAYCDMSHGIYDPRVMTPAIDSEAGARNNRNNMYEMDLKLKSCKISFVHGFFIFHGILLKFCTEHSSHTAVLCAKFQKD